MCSSSVMNKCLLAIEPYKFTGKEVGELREKFKGQWYDLNRYLPDFCIKEDGTVGWSENYHQFTDKYAEQEFIFFNMKTADDVLENELRETGLEGQHGILGDIVNGEQIFTGIIKDKFNLYRFDDYKRAIIAPQYIVLGVHWHSYCYPDYEWDVNYDIIGYLDNNLNLLDYEYEDKRVSSED